MARYRKIDVRMWGDARFRALSAPPASGRYLWIFLLTGPHTTNLPGLFRSGERALAEELDWPLEGFREGFTELSREGLAKADWGARVVWVPNAIKYNPPENPNVVKGWRNSWDEIPECDLKVEAFERLKEFTQRLGEGFGKAFLEGCAKSLANQEQEQEQEQEQTILSNPAGFDEALKSIFDYYLDQTGRNAKTYEFTGLRKRKGLSRLKECMHRTSGNVENAKALMCLAVDGLVASDWNMGRDPKTSGKRFCDWEKHLFDSFERMEGWWNRVPAVPVKSNGHAAHEVRM